MIVFKYPFFCHMKCVTVVSYQIKVNDDFLPIQMSFTFTLIFVAYY